MRSRPSTGVVIARNESRVIIESKISLFPTSGLVGSSVTLTGTNFGSSQGSSTLSLSGVAGLTYQLEPYQHSYGGADQMRQLGRYDSMGNLTSSTALAGTASAATSSFTYEPRVNQIATVTDPLNHTTSFTYENPGELGSYFRLAWEYKSAATAAVTVRSGADL